MKTTINKLIMKNFLLILLTIITITSCSSDEEIGTNSILGTWKLTSHSDVTPLPDCMKQTNITFSKHGNLSGEIYELNGIDCVKNTLVAKYEKETETLYTVILDNGNSDTLVDTELRANNLIWTEKSPTKTRVLNFVRQ